MKDIRRTTRRNFLAENKTRIVLNGLRDEDSIAELCRKEGIAQSLYYTWSKEFMESSKRRLAGDTARAASSDEVKDLRREVCALEATGISVSCVFQGQRRASCTLMSRPPPPLITL